MIAPVDWIAYVNQELRVPPRLKRKVFVERSLKVETITDFYRAVVNPIEGHLGTVLDVYV